MTEPNTTEQLLAEILKERIQTLERRLRKVAIVAGISLLLGFLSIYLVRYVDNRIDFHTYYSHDQDMTSLRMRQIIRDETRSQVIDIAENRRLILVGMGQSR